MNQNYISKRHQSVREPMMSMVPEEGSLLSATQDSPLINRDSSDPKWRRTSRAAQTISQIRTVGTVSGAEQGAKHEGMLCEGQE